jgi:benzoate membrane transport protein
MSGEPGPLMRLAPPPSAWSAALVATLVGFGGTVALVVQAHRALGASVEQIGSAVTASCLGVALVGGVLSFKLRLPVVLAWSTPGAALLAATTPLASFDRAVGAFLAAGVMITLVGAISSLGRWAERIPSAIASAMLAGVLLPFCLGLFRVGSTEPLLVLLVVGVFLLARQRAPRYAVLLVLAVGAGLTWLRGDASALPAGQTFGALVATRPELDVKSLLGLGVPLFLVTLVSQNLPGLVVLRVAGYRPPSRPLLVGTGVASLLTAPFGAHALCLAAITAAICTSEEAHPDRARRWTVGVLYAGFYLLLALVAPALVRLFLALPHAVIAAITGVALIPALLSALESTLASKEDREAGLVTFLATGSGLTLFGLGSALWGLVAGFLALAARAALRRRVR